MTREPVPRGMPNLSALEVKLALAALLKYQHLELVKVRTEHEGVSTIFFEVQPERNPK